MTYESRRLELSAAIRFLVDHGEYPSVGAAQNVLRTQINDAAFYRVRRKLIKDRVIDLSTIDRPENQFRRASG